jgi:hypothetical protein
MHQTQVEQRKLAKNQQFTLSEKNDRIDSPLPPSSFHFNIHQLTSTVLF